MSLARYLDRSVFFHFLDPLCVPVIGLLFGPSQTIVKALGQSSLR